MEKLVVGLIVLASYLVTGSFLAFAARKAGVRRAIDYYVAGYRLGGFLAALTYAATTYSAFMIVGLVGLAYATGAPSLGFELVYFVATLLLLVVLGPKAWRLARKRMWISPAEMIGDLYGSRLLAAFIAVLYLVALLPYISAQVKGIAEAIVGLGGESWYFYGVVFALIVILLWTLIAGLWSVAVTDALQGLWMIVSSVLLLAWLIYWGYYSNGVSLSRGIEALGSKGLLAGSAWSPLVFIAYTIPWIFFAATNPQVVQRLYMPRDRRAYMVMVAGFAVFGITFTVIVTLLGLLSRGLTELGILPNLAAGGRDAVTPSLLSLANPLISAIVFTSIVAAAVSTADSIILSIASSWATDLYKVVKRQVTEKELLIFGRTIVVVIALLAAYIGYLRISFIVELSVLSSVFLLPLAPITITAWLLPEKTKGRSHYALASLVLGEAIALAAYAATGSPRKAITLAILGLPTPFWVLVASLAPLTPIYMKGLKTATRREA